MNEGLRQLHALPHALAVGADLLVGGLHQVHGGQRAGRRFSRLFLVEAIEPDERRHPFESGHPLVKRILLGTEADLEIEVRVAPDRLAEHVDGTLVRLQLTGDQLHERGLAGAIRPQQPGDARRHRDGDVVEPDDLPVPLGHMVGRDDGHGVHRDAHVTISTPRTRRSRTEIDSAMSPSTITRETCQGVAYRGVCRKITSTTCVRFEPTESQENAVLPVMAYITPKTASVKKTMPL